ncbi:MAG: SMI1/KNR4 family protein [Gammaproteobacteria bacterium]
MMSEIRRILETGKSMGVPTAIPSPEDFRRAAESLGYDLPGSYIEFCKLGGLGELGFSHRILSPDEILATRTDVPGSLVPFADNGCGDLFCWPVDGGTEPAVIFHDQETQQSSPAAPSFTEWLARNRL